MGLEVGEQRVSVHGVEVRVQVAGEGTPLVYLHGAGGARWVRGLELLAARYRVYLPEHPGFGRTDRPEWLDTSLEMGVFYLDLLDALGLSGVNLAGHSIGGWIAAELASLNDSGLRRLVLVDAAGLSIPGEARLDMFGLPPQDLTRLLYHKPELAEQAAAVRADPEAQRAQVRNREMAARLGSNPYLCNPSLKARLRRIGVPTLVVWGANDLLIPPTHCDLYARAIPGARPSLIDQCGHAPAAEQPEEFARRVRDFLEERWPQQSSR